MDKFPVHYMMLYLPGNYKEKRPEIYWKSYHFTLAVKSGTLKDKSNFTIKIDGKETKVDKSNAHLCRPLFGKWLKRIAEEAHLLPAAIVPVPSKDTANCQAGQSRSYAMLAAACAQQPELEVVEALRFKDSLAKAATEKGTRDPRKLFEAMEVTTCAPLKKVILVDDVHTSGAHLRAARQHLVQSNFDVAFAAVCGWTVHSTDQPVTPGIRDAFVGLDNPDFADLIAALMGDNN